MKILVVDDHALVREGLRQVLKNLGDDVDVLEAGSCERAFEIVAEHPDLDLVLLDYHLPDMTGLEAMDIFGWRHPELPIIMLSGSINPQVSQLVMARGAAAFLTKSGKSDELLHVTRQVLAGEICMPATLPGHTPGLSLDADVLSLGHPSSSPPSFTPRQLEVLQLLLDGHSNKAIGRMLDLSDETVKNHITAILRGFRVTNRTQAVLAARSMGYRGITS